MHVDVSTILGQRLYNFAVDIYVGLLILLQGSKSKVAIPYPTSYTSNALQEKLVNH